MLNRPRAAADVWKRIGPGRGIYADNADGYILNASVLHSLGDHEAELALIHEGRARFPRDMMALAAEMSSLAALGRTSEVLARVDTMLAFARSESGIGSFGRLLQVAQELRVHGQSDASKSMLERVVREYEASPSSKSPASARWARALYYNAGQLQKASALAQKFAAQFPDSAWDQSFVGVLAAMAGNRALAERVMSRISALRQTFDPGPGLVTYSRARIAASLGEREMAVRLLQQAFAEGICNLPRLIHWDPALDGLRDDPAFREFVRPKG